MKYSVVVVILIAIIGFLWHENSNKEVSMHFEADEVGYYKLLESGNKDLRASNFVSAESKYEKAIKMKPNLFTGYNNRGCLKIFRGQYSEAIKDFDKAIRINTKYESAYFNKGIAKFKAGDRAGALSEFNQAVAIEPDPCNYFKRAHLKELMHDFEGAEKDYELAKAKESEHDHSEVFHEPALHYTVGLTINAN